MKRSYPLLEYTSFQDPVCWQGEIQATLPCICFAIDELTELH